MNKSSIVPIKKYGRGGINVSKIKRTYKELVEQYRNTGLSGYELRNIDDIKSVYGYDVTALQGYDELSDEHKQLFVETVVRFWNAHGIQARDTLEPKCVHFVEEITYAERKNESTLFSVGCEIYVLVRNATGEYVHSKRLHRYCYKKDAKFKNCEKFTSTYLRFELKGEWYHFTPECQWY